MKNVLLFIMFFPAVSMAQNVCMVGDSITAKGQHWRADMLAERQGFSYNGSKTDGVYLHDGVGGDTTADILLRLNDVPVCDITLLMAGGNDIAKGTATPGRIEQNLQLIADTLSSKGSFVYVMTLIPCDCSISINQSIVYTNSKIKNNLTGHTIIDTWSSFMNSGYEINQLLVDHFHPNDIGYQILTDYMIPRIN